MSQGLFITGTDTGVGKTAVTCALAVELRRQGHNVGVMKPILTGASAHPNDVDRLIRATQVSDPLELVNPYQFDQPLAPQIAAGLENVTIDIQHITAAFRDLQSRHDIVLVEGIGGVMVPIAPGYFIINLIQSFKIPTLIVTHGELGTINHTILTIRALQNHAISIAGLIMNQPRALLPEVELNATSACILESTVVPFLGTLRHIQCLDMRWDEGVTHLAGEIQSPDFLSLQTY